MALQYVTSLQNPKVKLARSLTSKKGRQAAGAYLVEGTKLLSEALQYGYQPLMTFATAEWWHGAVGRPLLPLLEGERFEVLDHVLAAIATTETPDGVVAVMPLPAASAVSLPDAPLVAIAHRLQDPGNLGTLIRAADAAGAHAVVVTDQTVDPFSPKVVRASMGSLFHLPVVRMSLPAWAAAHPNLPLYATSLSDSQSLYAYDFTGGAAFLIGNEGQGLAPEDEALAPFKLKIPILGRAESLNAAMAATVCLYEAARQRLARS